MSLPILPKVTQVAQICYANTTARKNACKIGIQGNSSM